MPFACHLQKWHASTTPQQQMEMTQQKWMTQFYALTCANPFRQLKRLCFHLPMVVRFILKHYRSSTKLPGNTQFDFTVQCGHVGIKCKCTNSLTITVQFYT